MDTVETVGGLSVRYPHPLIGAEVSGVDLTEDLPRELIDEIKALWDQRIVLVFRDQRLTLAQQKRFAARFGPLGERKRAQGGYRKLTEGVLQTDPNTLLVSNIKVDGQPIGAFGEGEMWLHIDSGYAEKPYKYTFLCALELPSTGGNTLFSNAYAVYDALPDDIKELIRGKKALHLHEYRRSDKADASGDISGKPHWFHPVAITHPDTGRKCLFVDRLMTSRIEGLDAGESDRVLNLMFDLMEEKRFVFEHEWRLGDVVMWDNRCAPHGRTWFPPEEKRLLRRCTVEGEPLHE